MECDDNMLCKPDNVTKTTIMGNMNNKDMNVKVCLCDDETGYIEQDGQCNGKYFISLLYNSFTTEIFFV